RWSSFIGAFRVRSCATWQKKTSAIVSNVRGRLQLSERRRFYEIVAVHTRRGRSCICQRRVGKGHLDRLRNPGFSVDPRRERPGSGCNRQPLQPCPWIMLCQQMLKGFRGYWLGKQIPLQQIGPKFAAHLSLLPGFYAFYDGS